MHSSRFNRCFIYSWECILFSAGLQPLNTCSCDLYLLLLLLLAARASAARGVVRFLGWHGLKLEFWHFAHPKLILRFLFASVFAVFCNCTNNFGSLRFASFFSVLSSVTGLSHRFLRCFRRLSTVCTCQLGLAFVFQLCAGGGGGGG